MWSRLTRFNPGISQRQRNTARRTGRNMWKRLKQSRWGFGPPNCVSDCGIHSKHQRSADSPRMMNDYRVVGTLSSGGMSIAINIVRKRSTGKLYVEKQVAKVDEWGTSRAREEIEALLQISRLGWKYHLNTMVEYAPGRDAHHIILHYCEGGNLKDEIDKTREEGIECSESFVWHVLLSGMIALNFLHGGPVDSSGRQDRNWNTICHLDIKPENIYLENIGERHPRVFLGDFGGAVSNSDIKNGRANLRAVPAWTPGWEAPEMLAEKEYGTKTDSWQLGGVAQTMCLLRSAPDLRALRSIRPCGRKYSEDLNLAVAQLTKTSVHRRMNAEDMLEDVQHFFGELY